jgi:hypothetical protein
MKQVACALSGRAKAARKCGIPQKWSPKSVLFAQILIQKFGYIYIQIVLDGGGFTLYNEHIK